MKPGARLSMTSRVSAPGGFGQAYFAVTMKWPRRFLDQQLSSLSEQNGDSSPLLTVLTRLTGIPKLTM